MLSNYALTRRRRPKISAEERARQAEIGRMIDRERMDRMAASVEAWHPAAERPNVASTQQAPDATSHRQNAYDRCGAAPSRPARYPYADKTSISYPLLNYTPIGVSALGLLARCEAAFDSMPVYLFRSTCVGVLLQPRNHGAVALTGPEMCAQLRGTLEDYGEWRGVGFAMVCDLFELAREDVFPRMDFASVVLHEAGHHLASIFGEPEPARGGHDGRFLRATLHLDYRARNCCSYVGSTLLPRDYGVGDPSWYAVALGDELSRTDERIQDILAAAPPAPWCELWKANTGSYVGAW